MTEPLVALRDWSDDDADWYAAQVGDPDIQRFTTEPETLTPQQFHAALADLRGNPDALGFVAVEATTGTRLANLAAARHDTHATVSYWVAPTARRRGVATRALRLLCERVTATWAVPELRLWTYADNTGSRRVAEHAGFTPLPGAPTTRDEGGLARAITWYHRPPS